MLLSASFQHAGFTTMHGFSEIAMAVVLPLIPIYTFITATYDGSLGALIIVSLLGLVTFFVGLGRWQIERRSSLGKGRRRPRALRQVRSGPGETRNRKEVTKADFWHG